MNKQKSIYALGIVCSALLVGSTTQAAVVFSDDFSDGDTAGWSFSGIDSGQWGVDNGVLSSSIGSDDDYEGRGYAFIDGLSTSDHFRITADVKSIGASNRTNGLTNFGHVGFVWDYSDESHFNTSYARIHSNHVTTWSLDGGFSGEVKMNTSSLFNNITYNMVMEVDYANQIMEITFNGTSTTYSGATFTNYLTNNGVNTGGSIGLIQWGEEVHYDNVVLEDLTITSVPNPGLPALLLLGLAALQRARAA